MQEIETTLFHLPKPSRQHYDYLDQLLASIEKEVGLTEQDIEIREQVAEKVGVLLGDVVQGSYVRLYGSCLTGFGLKSSVLNLDFQIPDKVQPHVALLTALDTITKAGAEFL